MCIRDSIYTHRVYHAYTLELKNIVAYAVARCVSSYIRDYVSSPSVMRYSIVDHLSIYVITQDGKRAPRGTTGHSEVPLVMNVDHEDGVHGYPDCCE